MHPPRSFLAALSFCAIAFTASAQLAEKGALLLEENFQRHATYTKEKLPLRDGWEVRVAHGAWQRSAEGVQRTWTTGHSPVLVLEGAFRDVIIELEFRYRAEPDKWAACRISPTNQVLNPRAYAASLWANVDFKSRAIGLVLEHDEWSPGHITQVSRKMTTFAPDTWHLLRLELIGDTALALLPLVLEERTQGVLAIRYLGARRFDDEERELLTNLTTQVALAFRNMLQLSELERRADRFALLARAQQQLTQLASEESLPQAIAEAVISGADLLIVHHGLFWSGVQPLVGMQYEKYRSILSSGLAVYSSHLPLDLHAEHGARAAAGARLRYTGPDHPYPCSWRS